MFAPAIAHRDGRDGLARLERNADGEWRDDLSSESVWRLAIDRELRRENFHRLARELNFETGGWGFARRRHGDGFALLPRGVVGSAEFPTRFVWERGRRRTIVRGLRDVLQRRFRNVLRPDLTVLARCRAPARRKHKEQQQGQPGPEAQRIQMDT